MATEQRRVVRVFLGSPSDLAPERRNAKDVVDKFNDQWADCFNLQIELVGWEDTVSVYGRPQDLINQDLSRCELFVGILWQDWGTPNGRYSSGFEEEFRLSEKSLAEAGRPDISLLFKDVEESRLRDPGERLKMVLQFRKEMQGKILFKTFGDEPQFRSRFERILVDHVKRLLKREGDIQAQETQSQPATADNPSDAGDSNSASIPQLPSEALVFVRRFISNAERSAQAAPIGASEVARFRLLGTLINRSGNNDDVLGVHDANILFADRKQISLTKQECIGLVDAGLAQFTAENVPYWYWLSRIEGFDGYFLPLRSVFGRIDRRAGTLRLMHLLRVPLFLNRDFDRAFYLTSWLQSSEHQSVREAALTYLGTCGIQEDLQAVKKEIDRADYQTVKAAINAYTRIFLRSSLGQALAALIELQPETIEESLLDEVFARPKALSDEALRQCLVHRSPDLRRRAAHELRSRGFLSKSEAEVLSNDQDPAVRLEGLLARLASGEPIDEKAAKETLIKERAKRTLLTLGQTKEGVVEFEKFQSVFRKRCHSLTYV